MYFTEHTVLGRTAAPCAAESSPGDCSAKALDNRPAEPAGTAPEPPPVVAKCSVMMGGQLVSRRRLFGCSGPKSGSAGSSWRPQLTQISAAPQTMAPVLQDKPRHSTDLAELCSPILLSLHWPTASLFMRIRNIFCHRTVAAAVTSRKQNASFAGRSLTSHFGGSGIRFHRQLTSTHTGAKRTPPTDLLAA